MIVILVGGKVSMSCCSLAWYNYIMIILLTVCNVCWTLPLGFVLLVHLIFVLSLPLLLCIFCVWLFLFKSLSSRWSFYNRLNKIFFVGSSPLFVFGCSIVESSIRFTALSSINLKKAYVNKFLITSNYLNINVSCLTTCFCV